MKLLTLTPFVISLALLAPASALADTSAHAHSRGGHAHKPIKWSRGGHASVPVAPRDARLWRAIQLALRNSGRMSYSQSGSRGYLPMNSYPPATDCSGFATWVLRMGGTYVPLSTSYSFMNEGRAVPASTRYMRIGDLVVYSGHVEVYVGHGRTVGHGSPGVHWHSWNYRSVVGVRRIGA